MSDTGWADNIRSTDKNGVPSLTGSDVTIAFFVSTLNTFFTICRQMIWYEVWQKVWRYEVWQKRNWSVLAGHAFSSITRLTNCSRHKVTFHCYCAAIILYQILCFVRFRFFCNLVLVNLVKNLVLGVVLFASVLSCFLSCCLLLCIWYQHKNGTMNWFEVFDEAEEELNYMFETF